MRLWVFILCVLLFAGCASKRGVVSSSVSPSAQVTDTLGPHEAVSEKLTKRMLEEIFESGVKNYLIGNYKLAIENLYKSMDIININGNDFPAGSAYYLGRIYADLTIDPDGALEKYQSYLKSFFGDDIDLALNFENPFEDYTNCADSAKKYLKAAAAWDEGVMRYKETFYDFLINTAHDTVMADSTARAMCEIEGTKENYMRIIRLCKDKREQLQLYLEMEKKFGPSRETNTKIFQLYKESGDVNKAISALKRLAENGKTTVPADANFNKIYYARQLLDVGKEKEAYNIAHGVLQEYPKDESASAFMVYYYRMVGNLDAMYETIKMVVQSPNISRSSKYDILSEMIEIFREDKEDRDITLSDCPKLIEVLHIVYSELSDDDDILSLFEWITEDDNDLSESTEELYYEALMVNPENAHLFELLINYYISKNNCAKCIELCEEGIKYIEPVSIIYLYEARCYLRQQQYEEMFRALDKGIMNADAQEEAQVLSDLYNLYGLGCYYVDPPSASENYEKALEYDSLNLDCIKNYCCYLIDYWDNNLGERLLDLSQRAMDIDSSDMETNTYYAMSLMLVGQNVAAKERIDSVISEYGIDNVYDIVLEYAGDIYHSVGQSEQANELWKRAEAITNDETIKARINKKIEK